MADSACPRDEHGRYCALVSDELALLESELSSLASGEATDGLCHASISYPPPQPTIDVELSSPDGAADLGLLPSPQRVQVSGVAVLRREQVLGACGLLDGQPALVQVGPVRDGRQTVTVRRRPSTPLTVTVKTSARTPVVGWLHAIPPFDWPDTQAVSAPLVFVGSVAAAPPRVATPADSELGVWSVVSVKVGRLVAAQLVGPNEQRVTLTPGPAATMRVRVTAAGKSLPLARAWFEDVLPDSPMECAPESSWGRWGMVDLAGATTALLEVPPGARRCVFIEAQVGTVADEGHGTVRALEVVSVRAPVSPGQSTHALHLPGR